MEDRSMLTPATMTGKAVRLEPLAAEHAGALAAAAAEDRSSYAYTWVPDGLADAQRYVQAALEQQSTGRTLVHVVRRLSDDRIAGTTRFLDLELFTWPPPWPPGVTRGPLPTEDQPPSVAEIGSTWYSSSAQRTGVNLEVKLLRVTLKTDARNASSMTAIERLGARAEGVRRAHAPASDGTVRDSAYYSILRPEWPDLRNQLHQRLARGGTGAATRARVTQADPAVHR